MCNRNICLAPRESLSKRNDSYGQQAVSTSLCVPHPQEDVLGRVEACGVDACRVRGAPLADDAAGEAGDGALDRLAVAVALTSRHSICHHKVDGALRRPPDLRDGNGGC